MTFVTLCDLLCWILLTDYLTGWGEFPLFIEDALVTYHNVSNAFSSDEPRPLGVSAGQDPPVSTQPHSSPSAMDTSAPSAPLWYTMFVVYSL